ncbi:unnamed protein product [Mesocestoides corti]|uniref:Uncharacterized protein n=1 Tax=Mesocestoides corti TaxID=53468 RepID=A0A0R3U1C4_MESCO|nr:unnamed protein product [Mesocestoides corti]
MHRRAKVRLEGVFASSYLSGDISFSKKFLYQFGSILQNSEFRSGDRANSAGSSSSSPDFNVSSICIYYCLNTYVRTLFSGRRGDKRETDPLVVAAPRPRELPLVPPHHLPMLIMIREMSP